MSQLPHPGEAAYHLPHLVTGILMLGGGAGVGTLFLKWLMM
jgi:hypothetical protein